MIALWFAVVLAVHDGDTFKARVSTWPGQTIETSVRILGIDAAELKSRCPREHALALQARAALADLVKSNYVFLSHLHPDKYGGRMLAVVTTSAGVDVGAELLKRGIVASYDGRGAKRNWCAQEKKKETRE